MARNARIRDAEKQSTQVNNAGKPARRRGSADRQTIRGQQAGHDEGDALRLTDEVLIDAYQTGLRLRGVSYALELLLNAGYRGSDLRLEEPVTALIAGMTIPAAELDGDCPEVVRPMWRDAVEEIVTPPMSPKDIRRLVGLKKQVDARLGADDDRLKRNLRFIGQAFSLTAEELKLLEVSAVIDGDEYFTAFARKFRPTTMALRGLSDITGIPVERVNKAIGDSGRLRELGLLNELDSGFHMRDLEDLFDMSGALKLILRCDLSATEDVAANLLKPLAPGMPNVDFSYLGVDGEIVAALVDGALKNRTAGVNILLHGEPGCGKTEYAKWLMSRLGASAYEVSPTDERGGEPNRTERFAAFRMTQRMLPPCSGGFVVFDEAEDVFQARDENPYFRTRSNGGGKAWVNRLLETAPWPTVWISNRVSHIDPAFMRRFTYVLPFPRPNRAARSLMVARQFESVNLRQDLRDQLAELTEVTPALIANVAQVVQLMQPVDAKAPEVVRKVVERYSDALGFDNKQMTAANAPIAYDASLLNLDGVASGAALVSRAMKTPQCAMVFYGPSGTGKTALADHLARQLGLRLCYRTASDLLSPYVGVNERNVRAMFENADAASDLIFLDEADSLLGNRESARSRWEASLTNEFLRGIEKFTGRFICATNHLSAFDPALMRRFQVKVGFLPLTLANRLRLFASTAGIAEAALTASVRSELARMDGLCVGDFANVARNFGLDGPQTAERLLESLAHEWKHKPGAGKRAVGFS